MDNASFRPSAKSIERLLITGLILLGWALIAVFRLVDLQVFQHARYVRAAEVQQDKRKVIEAVRGPILDRNGAYLAISSPSLIAVVNPLRITNIETAAGLVGSVLGLDTRKLRDDLDAALNSKHPGYFVVAAHVPEQKAQELRDLNLEWLDIRQGSVRDYPDGSLAAHVIGNVGGDGRGAAGVEAKLNKDLAGQPGWERVKVDVRGHAYESEVAASAVPGKAVALTIDSQTQHVAEQTLQESVVKNHADHGSVVAMDPYTGEVLALANYPSYDLNEHLHAGQKGAGREDLAVVSPFEPGSVFKVVTVSTALETTSLTPMSLFDCSNGSFPQYGRVIHDAERHGTLNLADVLAKSSNIGAVRIGMVVGPGNMYRYIRRLGFGQRTGIELPAEARGMVRPFKRWTPNSMGSIPMGHEISVTSLQLAQLGSVIANGGFLVHPHIVAWKQAPGGEKEYTRPATPVQVLQPQTVMTMRSLMRRVVQPGGTAQRLHVIGYSLAGKTGTAQIFDFAHRVYTHKYNASFMGLAPSTNPKLVVVVTISGTTGEAGFGASAAGPVFEAVMATALRHFSIPRDVPEEVEELLAKQAKAKEPSEPDLDDAGIASLDPPTEGEMQAAAAGGRRRSKCSQSAELRRQDYQGRDAAGDIQWPRHRHLRQRFGACSIARAGCAVASRRTHPGEVCQVMQLARILDGIPLVSDVPSGLQGDEVRGLAYDSRKVEPGFLFFAFAGAKTDGVQYAAAALQKGALAVLSDRPAPGGFAGPWIQVAHGRQALATASGNFFNHPDRRLALTAVTGTNGKTTSSMLIDSMLRSAGKTTALVGTIEYHLGGRVLPAVNTTPESLDLFRMFSELEQMGGTHATLEASSHALDLGRIFAMQFHTAGYTNFTRDHLDYHHTMEAYFAAKQLLFTPRTGPPPGSRC